MSLAETHPELLQYWHPTLNGGLLPTDVTYGSRKNIWWQCELRHETCCKAANYKERFACKICTGQEVLAGFNDLATTHPELLNKWHSTKNLPLTPHQVSKGSHKRVVWVCDKNHEWEAMIYGVFGCPHCKQLKAKVSIIDKYPDVAKLWDYEKNTININDTSVKGKELYWWICEKSHSFQSIIANQIAKKKPCKVCSANDRTNTRTSKITYRKKTLPKYIPSKSLESLGEYESILWKCISCQDSWLANKTEMSSPYLQGFHICNKTRKRLFEEKPELMQEWDSSKNFKVTKESVNIGSNAKYWWVCDKGHEWEATGSNRYKGAGCLHCSKSGYKPLEPALLYFLYNDNLHSFKVGITNFKRDRLTRFNKLGWICLQETENNDGTAIKNMEREFFKWLREEKDIQQHLDKADFGYVMGATETFSAQLITKTEVLNKIAELKTIYCK